MTILRTRSFWRSKNPNPRNSLVKTVNENGPPVRSATSERTQSLRFRNQIRGEVAVERRERSRVIGRGPEGDVSIGADQDQAARRGAGADGIDVGVVKRSPRAWTSAGPASRAKRPYLSHTGRSAAAEEKQPTGPGPEGCDENGPAAVRRPPISINLMRGPSMGELLLSRRDRLIVARHEVPG